MVSGRAEESAVVSSWTQELANVLGLADELATVPRRAEE